VGLSSLLYPLALGGRCLSSIGTAPVLLLWIELLTLGASWVEANSNTRLVLRKSYLCWVAIAILLSVQRLAPHYATHYGTLPIVIILLLLNSLWGV